MNNIKEFIVYVTLEYEDAMRFQHLIDGSTFDSAVSRASLQNVPSW